MHSVMWMDCVVVGHEWESLICLQCCEYCTLWQVLALWAEKRFNMNIYDCRSVLSELLMVKVKSAEMFKIFSDVVVNVTNTRRKPEITRGLHCSNSLPSVLFSYLQSSINSLDEKEMFWETRQSSNSEFDQKEWWPLAQSICQMDGKCKYVGLSNNVLPLEFIPRRFGTQIFQEQMKINELIYTHMKAVFCEDQIIAFLSQTAPGFRSHNSLVLVGKISWLLIFISIQSIHRLMYCGAGSAVASCTCVHLAIRPQLLSVQNSHTIP